MNERRTWLAIIACGLAFSMASSVPGQDATTEAGAWEMPASSSPALPLPGEAATDSQQTPTAGGLSPGGRVVMSLAVVLGIFFLTAWFQRKRGGRSTGSLDVPAEAVEVLGETSIGGDDKARLIRIGAKLLLVAESTSGLSTLTEITERAEVERLTELCHVMNHGRRGLRRDAA